MPCLRSVRTKRLGFQRLTLSVRKMPICGMSRTTPLRTEDRGQVFLAEKRLDPGKSDARRTKCSHLVIGRMDRLHQELRESLPLVLVESSAQWIVPDFSLIRFDDGIERMSLRPIETELPVISHGRPSRVVDSNRRSRPSEASPMIPT